MYLPQYSNNPDTLGILVVIIAPLVFVLCRLYNAHRMGKFKKSRHTAAPRASIPASGNTYRKALLIAAGLLAGLLLGLAYRFIL